MKRIFLVFALMVSAALMASADEGMWMINAIDRALEKNMKARGLKLGAREIYDADAKGTTLSDAVVALDFGCTGSIISDEGLLITNHHCAYADIHSISTPQRNYLEDGFWAFKSEEERYIPGKNVFFLKKVIDVTEEVNALEKKMLAEGKHFGIRKLSFILEKEYKKEYPEYEPYLSSMWSGEKYYMALYLVYSDIRLVAAPPVSIAAFGGDIDNWEWPQHKCDFAMYRVYADAEGKPAAYSENNLPLKPVRKLKISTKGYKPGDFNMVIGFPGRTDRWSSSFKLVQKKDVTLPISNEIRGKQMEITEKWMNAEPQIRLMYSNWYFGLSNVQELNEGEVLCYNRFNVAADKRAQEAELARWIAASPQRSAKWSSMLSYLETKYKAVEDVERNRTWFRETLVRGSRMSLITARLKNSKSSLKAVAPVYKEIDLRVEKELFAYSAEMFLRNVDREYWSDFQKDIVSEFTDAETGKTDYKALCDSIWAGSYIAGGFESLKNSGAFDAPHGCGQGGTKHEGQKHEGPGNGAFGHGEMGLGDGKGLNGPAHGGHAQGGVGKGQGRGGENCRLGDDPLFRFLQDVKITVFNEKLKAIEGNPDILALGREYTHALYEMRLDKGEPVYPNANSTMRITYGTVGGLNPYDAVHCGHQSSLAGVLEKHNPSSYDFCLKDDWKRLLESGEFGVWGCCIKASANVCGSKSKKTGDTGAKTGVGEAGVSPKDFPVDFLNNCDITGGNSGSPVLNARGELIGLAFDGNKESLASDASYTPNYNKCVCVDIRYVLFTLDRYAHLDRLLDELGF